MLFTVFFTATRNIKVSIILTGLVIILTMELFNEKSKNCILPQSIIDFMNKEKEQEQIKSKKEEIKRSIDILKKYKVLS
jgi:Na+/H+ antiporter NhaB